ncbi:TraB/GumN family protein [Clostridium sp. AL.422]|uniref:TraB/GumN family protein n=1 Tax=Clostridium TaxID=1485 RepID=UPI00293DAF51|nr:MULTISPECIES: TraB/GumN family protein [unclassified Clostridium]MDV4151668.1 TraB/GumN family protein [Clostridium sp. AL.422]
MIKRFKLSTSLILVFMVLVTLVGCEPKAAQDTRPVAKGFIWEATSVDGNSVTLVGTMHPAPNTHILLNDKLKEILNSADILTVEVDTTVASSITKLQKSMNLEDGDTIEKYLSTDEINKLKKIINSNNQNINSIKKLNAYGLNQVILANQLKETGFAGSSTDLLLMNQAKINKIEIDEIEGIDFQINLLNDIYSWNSLKEYINKYNDELKDKEIDRINKLFHNYVNSDVENAEKLEAKLREETDEEIYNLLNIERNKGMANKIDELIKDGKKRVVAVGYRHYMGEDSVLDFLEEKGYTIKKIEI